MGCAAGLLGTMAGRTAVMFNDGLRYIAQARRIDAGSWKDGLLRAVDHPAYPSAIALMHRTLGVSDSPDGWQKAAQAASALAGVLWVAPLYLVAMELFGGASAWLAVVLALVVPMTGHVLADVLSEGTFLLFWTWGLYTALRFLRDGSFAWLPPTIAFAALAYLARPEGLLLPMALVVCLAAMPLLRSTRMLWPRWWAAVGFLVIGPAIAGWALCRDEGRIGDEAGDRAATRHGAEVVAAMPSSALEAARPKPIRNRDLRLLATKAMGESVRDAVTRSPCCRSPTRASSWRGRPGHEPGAGCS